MAERLVLKSYRNPNAPPKKRKTQYIDDPDAKIPTQDVLQRKGHSLAVCMEKGDRREIDTTCDSAFMKKVMPIVGKRIRKRYAEIGVSDVMTSQYFFFSIMREGMEPRRWSTNM